MKSPSILIAALLASPVLSFAASSSYSITADFPFVTDYVFRGIKSAEESTQPSLQFSSGNFYATLWTNQPVKGGYNNEFDYTLGYTMPLSERWSLDVGATYYDYPETGSDAAQFEPFVGLTGALSGGLSASAYVFQETEFDLTTLQTSLGYTVDLSPQLGLEFGGDLGCVLANGDGDYTYWALSTTLRAKLNEQASAYLGLTYSNTDMNHATSDLGDEVFFFTTGLSIGF